MGKKIETLFSLKLVTVQAFTQTNYIDENDNKLII